MAFVKVCQICNTPNISSEMMCKRCMGDISGVSPSEVAEAPVERHSNTDEGKTIIQRDNYLILKTHAGIDIKVKDGDMIGRDAVGQEILSAFKTVSREHVKITCEDGKWFMEDLDSTNGTYINGNRIPSNTKIELRPCQISLSTAVVLSVVD